MEFLEFCNNNDLFINLCNSNYYYLKTFLYVTIGCIMHHRCNRPGFLLADMAKKNGRAKTKGILMPHEGQRGRRSPDRGGKARPHEDGQGCSMAERAAATELGSRGVEDDREKRKDKELGLVLIKWVHVRLKLGT